MNIDKLLSRLPIKALRDSAPLVPVVRLYGVIAAQGAPLRTSENMMPVYVFCEDVAASGGYWIACAGDEIYTAETSIIGSIGVIAATFGFEEAIKKLGVERRLFTAGSKKSLLDPFLPLEEADIKRLSSLQKEIHENFKQHVRTRRDGRLKASERKLFTGEFWTGAKALDLGLTDGIGDLKSVLQNKFGEKVRLPVVGADKSWLQRRFGLATQLSRMDLPSDLLAAAEVRAHWARYGL